jgi:hypothetical protein
VGVVFSDEVITGVVEEEGFADDILQVLVDLQNEKSAFNDVTIEVHSRAIYAEILEAATRDVIKDEIGGKLPSGRPFRPDVRARPRLPRGCGFTRGRVFTVRGRGKNRVRTDAAQRPRGQEHVHADAKINK